MPIAIVPMTDEFNWNLHIQGWVLSSFAIGYISCQVAGASLTKKYGGKNALTFAVILWSMSTFLVPLFAHSFYALVFARIVLGLGEGLGLPTIFHIFSHGIPTEERSRAFGYLVAFGSIGQTVASVICPHLSWEMMFYLFGALGFMWVFIWLYVYKDTRGSDVEEFIEPPKVNNLNVNWQEFLQHWPLWSIYIAHFSMNWSSYTIMHWLPTYLTRSLGADKNHIMLTAVPYVLNSVVGVVAGVVVVSPAV